MTVGGFFFCHRNRCSMICYILWKHLDEFFALALQAVRPSLDDIPEQIIPLLESCWAHDPKTRPEFMEITDFLSNVFKELCSTEAEPPKVVETEGEHPENCNVKKEESAITNHVIDRPEEKKGKRRKKSRSLSFLRCFVCKCWCG